MKKILILSSLTMLLTGCGTLFTGTTKTVNINISGPNVDNKTLLINGRQYPISNGYTSVRLNKSCNGASVYLQDKKSGKLEVLPSIESSFQPVSILNLLNWLGWGIDFATGAVCTYESNYSVSSD